MASAPPGKQNEEVRPALLSAVDVVWLRGKLNGNLVLGIDGDEYR
jgi:hypothetical protein